MRLKWVSLIKIHVYNLPHVLMIGAKSKYRFTPTISALALRSSFSGNALRNVLAGPRPACHGSSADDDEGALGLMDYMVVDRCAAFRGFGCRSLLQPIVDERRPA